MQYFHCKTVKNIAMGAVGDFPYSAELYLGEDPTRIKLRFPMQEGLSSVLGYFKSNPVEYTTVYSEYTGDGKPVFACEVHPPTDFYVKSTLYSLLKEAEKAFADATPLLVCPLCGGGNCDSRAFLEEDNRLTHSACVKNRLSVQAADRQQPPSVTGSYLRGAAGALLGALLGALPSWAQAMSQGRVTTILYLFIPFMSALLYRLLRGKASRNAAAVSVLFSSVLVAFIMELFLYWLVLSYQAGYNISIWESSSYFFASFSFASAVRNMFSSLLFVLIGFFVSAILLRRYAAAGTRPGKTIRGSLFIEDSLVPLNPESAAPEQGSTGKPAASSEPPVLRI